MINLHDPEQQKINQHYHLKCKVMVKEISYVDYQSKENVARTEEMVYLIPDHTTTQGALFLSAWLPETSEDSCEVIFETGYPINGVFRGAVERRNEKCNEHHIFVMSRGAEEDLKQMRDKTIIIMSLPANQDAAGIGDKMKNFDLADDKSDKIVTF